MTPPKNIAASVRQRLLNRAKLERRPFNELLHYYGMERFLYRLSQSSYADQFVLKGALMLRVWRSPELRPTMDIDLLGRTSNNEADIIGKIRGILAMSVTADGLTFDKDSVKAERIVEDEDYEGTRIRFQATLDSAKVNMRLDIGFGDVVYPDPKEAVFPTLLDFPAPRLLCYSRESSISEKLEAMVKLGTLNSRMKDFYDVWLLSRQFDFDGDKLAEAIRLTFKRRGTKMPLEIEAFTGSFIETKQVQWRAFGKRIRHDQIPASFREIIASIDSFLSPVIATLVSGTPCPEKWIAPGPWT